MKIFISWSQERSQRFAEIFKIWLPKVIQAVEPYCSSADIAKGARWSAEMGEELEKSTMGLILITPENMGDPWINFEAGALSKNIKKSKVCPILFDLKISDLSGPLSQFQITLFNREDMKKLVKMVNSELPEKSLSDNVLEESFDVFWPKLENQINSVGPSRIIPETQGNREILNEILLLTRSINNDYVQKTRQRFHNKYELAAFIDASIPGWAGKSYWNMPTTGIDRLYRLLENRNINNEEAFLKALRVEINDDGPVFNNLEITLEDPIGDIERILKNNFPDISEKDFSKF